ncbi:MAG: tyrosine-type recombinase/integrase [Roseiarcus sp.]
MTGFGLRVFAPTTRHPAGARSFFINYRADGVERRHTIGAFPEWSALAARKEAKALRKRIDRGEDPARDKRDKREAPTVKDLADRYKAEHLPGKAAQSQKNDWAMIINEILPEMGARKVQDVHYGDILSLHKKITTRGAPVRANRVLAVASKMFSLALRPAAGEDAPWRDAAQGNPCKGLERNQEEGKERFFSTAEIAALSDALAAQAPTPARNCVRFIMLTGCRPGEAMRATWTEFVELGYWDKPSAHTKQRKRHRVPLTPAAIELIDRIRADRKKSPRESQSDFVFPGQSRGEPLKQLRTTWEDVSEAATIALWRDSADPRVTSLVSELDRSLEHSPTVAECRALAVKTGVKLSAGLTDARLYDCRHSFASIGAGGGLSLQIIGRLLGHTQSRTTQRYAHLGDDPLKEAAAKIGAVIAGAGKETGNVERPNWSRRP